MALAIAPGPDHPVGGGVSLCQSVVDHADRVELGRMDDMLTITLVITGAFFIAINLFIVVARYRRRGIVRPTNRTTGNWNGG